MSQKLNYTKIKPKVGYSRREKNTRNYQEGLSMAFYMPQNKETYKKIAVDKKNKRGSSSQNDSKENISMSLPSNRNDSRIKVMSLRNSKNQVANDYNRVSQSLNQQLKSNNAELNKLLSKSHRTHMPFIQKTSLKIKEQMMYDYQHVAEKKSKHSSIGKLPLSKDKKKVSLKKPVLNNKTPIKINKRTHSATVTDKDTTISSGSIVRDQHKNTKKSPLILNRSSLIDKKPPTVKIVKTPKVIKPLRKTIRAIHDKSKTGMSGDEKKYNQDSFFIFSNFNGNKDYYFLGVCDGHGLAGHEISGFIKENLPSDLNNILKAQNLNSENDNIQTAIEKAFVEENMKLLRQTTIDYSLSGTTCVSVIYTPQKLITANIGDSRAVLGKYINKQWINHDLSNDHKPSNKIEAERILKTGIIRQMRDDGELVGPLRVYMKSDDLPGLAMTRSFGDYYASLAGTISVPEIIEYKYQPEDKFMILASDGLFEYIDSKEVVLLIKDYYLKNDIVGCCDFLYEESKRRWISQDFDAIDDITMIVVFFD